MGWNVTVDSGKCTGCGECADVCPVEVYAIVDGVSAPVNAVECLGCETCLEVCDTGALKVYHE